MINKNDQVMHQGFIHNTKTSQYACNSATIDDTYAIRILTSVGREFIFTLDVDLSGTSLLNEK